MPDKQEERLATPAMVLRSEQWERQQFAKEVAERAKDPLDESKRPGGFYIRGSDGMPLDANGIEIKEDTLSADHKKAVSDYKKTLSESASAQKESAKEAASADAEAAKQAEVARQAHEKAEATRLDAMRAQAHAEGKRGKK